LNGKQLRLWAWIFYMQANTVIMEDTKTQAPPTAQQQFLSDLRAATADQHKALEATPLSAKLVSKELTIDAYVNYLLHMRDVVVFCEQTVFPVVQHLFGDLEQRRKLAAIDEDLEVLTTRIELPVFVPAFVAAIPDDDVAFALGCMYVVEGSTLGGRMLLTHVKGLLGLSEYSGGRFFAGYGADTGSMWKEFIRVMSDYAVQNICTGQVVAGARYAFSAIEHHFAQNN